MEAWRLPFKYFPNVPVTIFNGSLVLKYDYAEAFAGGLAIVQLKGETFMVNNKGAEIKGGVNPFGE